VYECVSKSECNWQTSCKIIYVVWGQTVCRYAKLDWKLSHAKWRSPFTPVVSQARCVSNVTVMMNAALLLRGSPSYSYLHYSCSTSVFLLFFPHNNWCFKEEVISPFHKYSHVFLHVNEICDILTTVNTNIKVFRAPWHGGSRFLLKVSKVSIYQSTNYYYYYYYYYLLQLGFHPMTVVLTLVHTIQPFSSGGSSPYTSTHNTNVFTRWQ
jgi:hypothetical protein